MLSVVVHIVGVVVGFRPLVAYYGNSWLAQLEAEEAGVPTDVKSVFKGWQLGCELPGPHALGAKIGRSLSSSSTRFR